jgi:subfamily B ATP-binding cassette protein MsbA
MLGLLPPLLLMEVVDSVISNGEWDLLTTIVVCFIGIAICSAFARFASQMVLSYLGQKVVFGLRNRIYDAVMQQSLRFYDEYGAGQLMTRVMEDTKTIQQMVKQNCIVMLNHGVSIIFAVGAILYLKWELGVLMLLLAPLYVLNHRHFVPRIKAKRRQMLREREKMAGEIEERVAGTKLVKAFSQEERESKRLEERMDEVLELSVEGSMWEAGFMGASTSITTISNTLVYCSGCYMVLTGYGGLTYGAVMAIMQYVNRLLRAALQFTQVAGQAQQTFVSMDRVFEIIETIPEIESKKGAPRLPKLEGRVEFKEVNFGYEEGRPVLKDFSLKVPAGKTVALVGHTGSGKTTITSLLQRFYDPQEGSILVDGFDLRDVELKSLRFQEGQVLQQPYLFCGTISENLSYGNPDCSAEEILQAAKVADIHEWIESLPDGYDTEIGGESPVTPSLGQKQQLSIARAVLVNPAILILDEATSSLDAASEAHIQKAMDNVLVGRTSFIVAHRLSTIRRADIIVVLDDGRKVEQGTHDELMNCVEGAYRNFYISQARAMLEEDGVIGESRQSETNDKNTNDHQDGHGPRRGRIEKRNKDRKKILT